MFDESDRITWLSVSARSEHAHAAMTVRAIMPYVVARVPLIVCRALCRAVVSRCLFAATWSRDGEPDNGRRREQREQQVSRARSLT